MRKVKILCSDKIGYFHSVTSHDGFLIELEDGTVGEYGCESVQFIDSAELSNTEPDWEQRGYELAKAAMQGMLANTDYVPIASSNNGLIELLAQKSAKIADAMIAEFKKQNQ